MFSGESKGNIGKKWVNQDSHRSATTLEKYWKIHNQQKGVGMSFLGQNISVNISSIPRQK